MEELETQGYFDTGLEPDSSIRITKALFQDFQETDLFKMFDPNRFGHHEIVMAHGEHDQVIDPDAAKRFAELFNIPIIIFPDEGHSLAEHEGTADQVISRAIELFNS